MDATSSAAGGSVSSGGGDGSLLPNWVRTLHVLVPIASTLVTVVTNPVQFLQGPVLTIIVDAVIIKPATWVYGYLLLGADITASAISPIGGILASPFYWISSLIVGMVTTFYDSIRTILETLGLAAPVAGAAAVALMAVMFLTVAVALWRIVPGSDLVDGVTQWTR